MSMRTKDNHKRSRELKDISNDSIGSVARVGVGKMLTSALSNFAPLNPSPYGLFGVFFVLTTAYEDDTRKHATCSLHKYFERD